MFRCKMLRRRVDTIEETRIAWSSVGRRLYLVQGAPPPLRRPARSLSGCPLSSLPAKWVVLNLTSEYVREYHPLAARTPASSPGPPRPDDARPADLLGAVRRCRGAHRLRRLAVPLSALPRRRAGRRLPAAARPHRAPAQGPPPACRRTAHGARSRGDRRSNREHPRLQSRSRSRRG